MTLKFGPQKRQINLLKYFYCSNFHFTCRLSSTSQTKLKKNFFNINRTFRVKQDAHLRMKFQGVYHVLLLPIPNLPVLKRISPIQRKLWGRLWEKPPNIYSPWLTFPCTAIEDASTRGIWTQLCCLLFLQLPKCLCLHVQRMVWLDNGMPVKRYERIQFPEYFQMDNYIYSKTSQGPKGNRLCGGRDLFGVSRWVEIYVLRGCNINPASVIS